MIDLNDGPKLWLLILKVTLIFIHPSVTYFCGSEDNFPLLAAPSTLIFILHFAQSSSSEWLVFETAIKQNNSQKYSWAFIV